MAGTTLSANGPTGPVIPSPPRPAPGSASTPVPDSGPADRFEKAEADEVTARPALPGNWAAFARRFETGSVAERQRTLLSMDPRSLVGGDASWGLSPMSPERIRELAETPHAQLPRIRDRLMDATASPIDRAMQEGIGENFQRESQQIVDRGREADLRLRGAGTPPRPEEIPRLRQEVEAGRRARQHLEVFQSHSLSLSDRWSGQVNRAELDSRMQETLRDPEVRQRLARAMEATASGLSPRERTRLLQEQREYLNGPGFQQRLALFPAGEAERQLGLESARMALLDPSLASADTAESRVRVDILGRPAREWMDRAGYLPGRLVPGASGIYGVADSLVQAASAEDGTGRLHLANAGLGAAGVASLFLRGALGVGAGIGVGLLSFWVDRQAQIQAQESLLRRNGFLGS